MDDYHGTKVADPYRWLEDETSPADGRVDRGAERRHVPVSRAHSEPRSAARARHGAQRLRALRRAVAQRPVLLLQQERRPAEPERAAHSATASTARPRCCSIRTRGPPTARCSSRRSSRRRTRSTPSTASRRAAPIGSSTRCMELATKRTLEDNVEWAKVSQVAWHGDGFYYSRYPEPPEGHEKASINENHQVFFHKLGTPQAADTLVFEDPANPQRFHTASTTEDERFAILEVSDRGKGLDGNALYVRDLTDADGKFAPLVPEITNDTFYVVDNVGDRILVATNHGAPNWRVVLIDPANIAEANWKTVLAERPEPIDSVTTAGGKLFATYLKDVATRAYVFSLDGTLENEIALPGLGTRRRLRRPERFAVRVLHVQLAERAADDLPLRHRDAREQRLPRAERAGLRRGAVRDEAGVLSEQGRHADPDVPRLPQGPAARRQQPDAALRLRRLQHRREPDVQRRAHRAARAGVRVCLGQLARRRRVRRGVAPAGDEARQAERLRRLHRGGRVADRAEVHVVGAARDHGPVERRAARRRRDEPAARAVRRRGAGSRRHGHAALPQVHDRLELDRGLRLERRRRGVQGAVRVLAAAQHPARREVSRRR